MSQHTLEIRNLHVKIQDKEIIRGVDLTICSNEVVALVGPNGHGKSCLLFSVIGHPKYIITEGSVLFDGVEIHNLSPDERAKLGLFLAFQNPPEIAGVSNLDYYKNIIRDENLRKFANFYKEVNAGLKKVGLSDETGNRELNVGFSGGEKKRHELLQMLLLRPHFVLLDEIDSGLDVDAINIVADIINQKKEETGLLLISHYSRLYDLVKPTRAVVLIDGKIVHDGNCDVLSEIDQFGYADFAKKRNISHRKHDENTQDLLGICATKPGKIR